MPDFTAKDLQFLKIMRILPPEEPELAKSTTILKMGLERTAARVNTWPEWKTGTTRKK